MQLFDILKLLFSNKQKDWDSVGNNDKNRNFFMINRIMSIQFPVQANQFNKLKVTPTPVIDWWQDTLSHRFNRPPGWLYTKANKKSQEEKKETKDLEEIEIFIRDKYRVSKRDLSDLKKFYPEKYLSWVSDVSEQIGIKTKNI
jgi:hypothetical protein